MIHRIILLSLVSIDVLILLYQTSIISISSHEADILYGDFSFIQQIELFSFFLFGQNDFTLRLPMILLHFFSIYLLYEISKEYVQNKRNQLWLVLAFILLPGVISSAILVDSAGFIIFGLLLFVYVYKNFKIEYSYFLLICFSVLDHGFLYLFFSLIFYSLYIKNKNLLTLNILLFATSLFIFGIKSGGGPKGHLLDTIGLYSAIFTPIIFVYIFYILYKRFLSKDINILWFISAVPLVLSLILSFRQNIYISDFAPYLIISLPLAAQTFYSSYRVRLKSFRGKYKTIFALSSIFLLVNFFVVLFNRELYLVIDNPDKHFAKKMYIAKELSKELHKRGIHCVQSDSDMKNRLKFYGVNSCNKYILTKSDIPLYQNDRIVTISYKYRPIYYAIVTKVNTK